MIVFDELEHFLLPPAKESHPWVTIDLGFLGVIELPRPSSINRTTHSTGESHQRSWRLQTTIGGPGITCDIPREIAF